MLFYIETNKWGRVEFQHKLVIAIVKYLLARAMYFAIVIGNTNADLCYYINF